MMIEYELDIPLLTRKQIQMNEFAFNRVKELTSSSMIEELIMIEMLFLLIDSFVRGVPSYQRMITIKESNPSSLLSFHSNADSSARMLYDILIN